MGVVYHIPPYITVQFSSFSSDNPASAAPPEKFSCRSLGLINGEWWSNRWTCFSYDKQPLFKLVFWKEKFLSKTHWKTNVISEIQTQDWWILETLPVTHHQLQNITKSQWILPRSHGHQNFCIIVLPDSHSLFPEGGLGTRLMVTQYEP